MGQDHPTQTPANMSGERRGLRSGKVGAGGLTARPGGIWAVHRPGGVLPPAPPTAPAAARAQVQANALPETRPQNPALHAVSHACWVPRTPFRPVPQPFARFAAHSPGLSEGLQPSFPLAGGEARERGSGWEGAWPPGLECALEVHLAASYLKMEGEIKNEQAKWL